jgi:hypothetical protein
VLVCWCELPVLPQWPNNNPLTQALPVGGKSSFFEVEHVDEYMYEFEL